MWRAPSWPGSVFRLSAAGKASLVKIEDRKEGGKFYVYAVKFARWERGRVPVRKAIS